MNYMTKYYCLKCKKYHFRGKIYKNHLEFKGGKEKKIPSKKINIEDLDIETFRPIAKRQIMRLLRKMRLSNKPEFYEKQIQRVILHENKNY